LTTNEISAHFAEVYGTQVSKNTIRRIAEKVTAEMAGWQTRPLHAVCPVTSIDAIVFKVRNGAVTNRPLYAGRRRDHPRGTRHPGDLGR